MNTKFVSRFLSACLALTLAFQLGSASAVLDEDPNTATASEGEKTSAESSTIPPENQEKWDQLAKELGANGNPISKYVNVHDNQPKVILWTQGITPPTIGESDSQLKPTTDPTGAYLTYQTSYLPGNGWYDVNKSGSGVDRNLCFAVAASNSLHWWLDQNNEYVERYIQEKPDDPVRKKLNGYRNSFESQAKSGIFQYFILNQFANRPNGYWPDLLHDHFINGYPYQPGAGSSTNKENKDVLVRDEKGGFLKDVFQEHLLTRRLNGINYAEASKTVKRELLAGNMIMPTYSVGRNTHVVTLWGAEFDLNGNLCGVFLSDSDDYDIADANRSMLRYTVNNSDGSTKITTGNNPQKGSFLMNLNSLSPGKEYWKKYFGQTETTLTLTWSNLSFSYDGQPHIPTATFSSAVQGDVHVVIDGTATDAGQHTATARLEGNDAGKYTLSNATQSFEITPATTSVTLTEKKTADKTYTLHAEIRSSIGNDTLKGTVTFSDGSNTIRTVDVTNGVAETEWTATDSSEHTISAAFTPANNNYKSSTNSIKINLNKKDQTTPLVFNVDNKTYGDQSFTLTATGGDGTGAFEYVSSKPNVISIVGDQATINGAGETEITATKLGDDQYNSSSVTIPVTVAKAAAPAINYPTAGALTYGQTLRACTLTGGSVDLGTFTWANADAVPSVGTADYEMTFTPSDTTKQNYESLPTETLTRKLTVTVSKSTPTVTLSSSVEMDDKGSTVTLTATVDKVNSGEIPNEGTVTFLNAQDNSTLSEAIKLQDGKAKFVWTGMQPGQYEVKAKFSGNTNYNEAESSLKSIDTTKPSQPEYTITVTVSGNGKASATPTSANEGTTIHLTASPAEGYEFKGWRGNVAVSNNSFVMPGENVTIQAIFEPKALPPQPSVPSHPNVSPTPSKPTAPNIVTNPDGSTTETIKQPDGSVVKKTVKLDGSRVEEHIKSNGSTSVTHTTPDGRTESQIKIPEPVTSDAIKNDQIVSLPMPPVSVQKDRPSSVTVDLGTAQNVTISVPVDKLSPGIVAVTVKPDGTKEVVRKSIIKDNGIVFTADGKTTLEIQDNTKIFEDANGHWASDAITFVTSHEIFNGTSATTFAPNTGITRGMLVKVLHNLEGNPLSIHDDHFSDVSANAWFADSVQWAVSKGIVNGINNEKFAPEKQISREDLAVMLYRYAGSPSVSNGGHLAFHDMDQVSAYADTAVRWAVENGIITGTDSDTLNPKGTATRGQTAVIMMRFINLVVG